MLHAARHSSSPGRLQPAAHVSHLSPPRAALTAHADENIAIGIVIEENVTILLTRHDNTKNIVMYCQCC
jgi:hypothetical protein